jgi:lipoprotein NlpD
MQAVSKRKSGAEKILMFCFLLLVFFVSGCSQKATNTSLPPYPRDLSGNKGYYYVKQGDTLFSIGFRAGLGYKRLARWNNIPPPYNIHVGQKIKLFNTKQRYKGGTKRNRRKSSSVKMRDSSQKKTLNSTNDKKLLKFNCQWPLKGTILKTYSQSGRKGIRIQGKMGQPVKAAASGKVVYSGNGLIGYGNLLIIKHNDTFLSAYANNSRLLVKEGQTVRKGQIIAEVGRGSGKKPSLHFEIRKNGKPVNPIWYLPRK